ncbi:MAG TPA: flavin reductase family protein [Pilimelia sp.]|nr:flavin reductase family protein [Pilimelia sp.]
MTETVTRPVRVAPVTTLTAGRRGERLSTQATLREVMGQFATGVTVLTTGGERAHGMTANSFTSVSLDPPMVLCCVSLAARMYESIASSRTFAVSILAADQRPVARHFADWRRPRGLAQFDGVDWQPGPRTGAPLLTGALAWVECRVAEVYPGGDHAIFLGEVLGSSRSAGPDALTFFGGDYHPVGARPRDRIVDRGEAIA